MDIDLLLFGRIRSGPFFARLEKRVNVNGHSVRILYAAIDQVVPGTLGGSTHVQAVAEGLAALGHEVHVAVRAGTPIGPSPGLTRTSVPFLRTDRRGTMSARRSGRRICGC